MTEDTREDERPCVCEECDEDCEECGCDPAECEQAMREYWMEGTRERFE